MSTLLDTIQEALGGEHYGKYLAVRCPFHGDHSPSMLVYEDWYRCQACGANGPTSILLKRAGKDGMVVPSFGYEDPNTYPNPFFYWLRQERLPDLLKRAWTNANLNPSQTQYLIEQRGLPETTRRKLGIGVLENFFTFPVTDRHQKIAGAFVRAGAGVPSSRYYVPKGQNPNLLYAPNWKRIEESQVIFVTFGPIDALSLHLLGFASISTLSGKNLDTTVLDDLRKVIVFIPDYGEDLEASRLASRLGWRGKVCSFPYPSGTKDINEVFLAQPELITATLEDSYGQFMARHNGDRGWFGTYRENIRPGDPTGNLLSPV